jgi:hypothetical protein
MSDASINVPAMSLPRPHSEPIYLGRRFLQNSPVSRNRSFCSPEIAKALVAFEIQSAAAGRFKFLACQLRGGVLGRSSPYRDSRCSKAAVGGRQVPNRVCIGCRIVRARDVRGSTSDYLYKRLSSWAPMGVICSRCASSCFQLLAVRSPIGPLVHGPT